MVSEDSIKRQIALLKKQLRQLKKCTSGSIRLTKADRQTLEAGLTLIDSLKTFRVETLSVNYVWDISASDAENSINAANLRGTVVSIAAFEDIEVQMKTKFVYGKAWAQIASIKEVIKKYDINFDTSTFDISDIADAVRALLQKSKKVGIND